MLDRSLYAAVAIAGTGVPFESAQGGQWSIVEGLPADTRIEIERISRDPILGEFQRATLDELFLRLDDRIFPVRRSEIRRVQTLTGCTVGCGTKNGLIIGGIIGAIVGVAVTHEGRHEAVEETLKQLLWGGVLLGAAIAGRSGAALALTAIYCVGCVLAIRAEEQALERVFGTKYRRYRTAVPRYMRLPPFR